MGLSLNTTVATYLMKREVGETGNFIDTPTPVSNGKSPLRDWLTKVQYFKGFSSGRFLVRVTRGSHQTFLGFKVFSRHSKSRCLSSYGERGDW